MEGLQANSAAGALVSLRMLQGLPALVELREIYKEDENRINSPQNSHSVYEVKREQIDEVLPVDLLAQCFMHLSSFKDMAMVSQVCKKWRNGIKQSLAYRKKLSFAGCRVDDDSVTKMVREAVSLLHLDMSAGRWGCRITNVALYGIADSSCCPNLRSVSLWGVTAITDEGVLQLVSKAKSLENLNVGGTFVTDVSLLAISTHCAYLKVLNLWGCKHVTEHGLLHLAKGCPKLQTMNVWGMKVNQLFMKALLELNPQLEIKPWKESAAEHQQHY